MTSTYVNNLRLNEMGTGDASGTWGTITNTNLTLIADALGYQSKTVASASTDTLTIPDGTETDNEAISLYVKLTGGDQACTITVGPNTVKKIWIIENATSQVITLTQGSGANVILAAGVTKMIYADGAGSGAALFDALASLEVGANFYIKNASTGDDSTAQLYLQTAEADIAVNDVLGKINFQAPNEGTGTDAILVAAAIQAKSEGDFSSSSNATTLEFMTGASEAATTKMSLSSGGNLDVTGDITGSTLNADGDTSAGDNAAIGYTASEGLILTGQGSTNDVTIKNDADADVISIPTGTTGVTLAGALSGTTATFTTADNDAVLTLKSTDADASLGPLLTLHRDSSSPADGDAMGRIYFSGENDAGEEIQYVRFQTILSDASDGTEDSAFRLQTYVGGATKSRVLHDPTETVINDDAADVNFRIESTNESNIFYVDAGSTAFVAIGETSAVNGGRFNVATSGATCTISSLCRSSTDSHQSELVFQKSSGNTGNFAATADGESLGTIKFRGVDTQPVSQVAAEISVTQDGSESGSVPAKLSFSTAGSAKWTIEPNGRLQGLSMSDYTRMIELMGSGNQSASGALRLGVYGNNSKVGMAGGVNSGYAGLQFDYYYLLPQIQQTTNNGDLRLGSSSYRFHTVYASNALDTSDERVKEEIENLDVGLDFIKALTPKKFKYKDKDEDGNYKDGKLDQTNGIKKWGLIAQEVKAVLDSNSISEDIGLWSTDKGECNGTVLEDQQQLQYK